MAAESVHLEALASMCRICGCILTRDTFYLVTNYYEELMKVFSVDFRGDLEAVHPQKFCLKCYAIMTSTSRRDGETGGVPLLWDPHTFLNCHTCGRREAKAKGRRPKMKKKGIGGGRFKNVMTVEDILKPNPKRKIPASVEKAASKIISIKMQKSDMPNKTVQLSSGSSRPLTLTPITVSQRI